MIYPMPKQMLLDFAAQHETVYVIEELDPFIETYCRSLGISVIGKEAFSLLGEYTPHQIRKVILGEEEPAYQVPGEPVISCSSASDVCIARTEVHSMFCTS